MPTNNIWEKISHAAIVGTDRSPLGEEILEVLGLQPSDDPAQVLLQALPVAKLLNQAAAPLARGPENLPMPALPDERPMCSDRATLPLLTMLREDVFSEVLPEYFQYLSQSGRRLPPECYPLVLEWAMRKRSFPEALQQALGSRGEWLASQHPAWQRLYLKSSGSWETSTFADRQQLLAEARESRPLVGLAWLEKTWAQERAEHRLRFLETFRSGLSPVDENLLEQALTDRSRPVRFLACRLLLLLPDSSLRQTLRDWLAANRNLFSKEKKLLENLEAALPEAGPLSKMRLLSLDTEKNNLPIVILMKLLPPEDLTEATGLSPEALLSAVFSLKNEVELLQTGFLENISWRGQSEWLLRTARYFVQNPEHPMWKSRELSELLNALPDPEREACLFDLAAQHHLLDVEHSALVWALRESDAIWPQKLVHAVLLYPRHTGRSRHWVPPSHFRKLLQKAAICCRIEDTAGFQDIEREWPYAWHGELHQFQAVIEFRRQLRRAFQ